MRKYTSQNQFTLGGEISFVVTNDETFYRSQNNGVKRNEIVEIDGKEWRVTGVCCWAMEKIREGEPIELRVEAIPAHLP